MTAPVEFFHGHTNVLQELTRVGGSKGFMGHTGYFSGPMLCSVPRVVGKEVRPHNCSTKFIHGHTNLLHELSRVGGT